MKTGEPVESLSLLTKIVLLMRNSIIHIEKQDEKSAFTYKQNVTINYLRCNIDCLGMLANTSNNVSIQYVSIHCKQKYMIFWKINYTKCSL